MFVWPPHKPAMPTTLFFTSSFKIMLMLCHSQLMHEALVKHEPLLLQCGYWLHKLIFKYLKLLPVPKATEISAHGRVNFKSKNAPTKMAMTSASAVRTLTVFIPCCCACMLWTTIQLSASSWLHPVIAPSPVEITDSLDVIIIYCLIVW